MNKILLFTSVFILTLSGSAQIAVTEFMNNPITNDADNEWIELYNYSNTSVDLMNWRLIDEDTDSTTVSSTSLIMQPNTYLVLAINKDSMEFNWFGGIANSGVVDIDNYALANGADEIILKDNSGNVIWSVAYANDEVNGIATFLEYSHDFSSSLTVWGSKATPGINRSTTDPISSTIGYQGDSATVDSSQGLSRYGDIKGSPLAGSYTPANTSSVERIPTEDKISIFPNPVKGDVINFNEKISGEVLDFSGKVHLSFQDKNILDIIELDPGTYLIRSNRGILRFIRQ